MSRDEPYEPSPKELYGDQGFVERGYPGQEFARPGQDRRPPAAPGGGERPGRPRGHRAHEARQAQQAPPVHQAPPAHQPPPVHQAPPAHQAPAHRAPSEQAPPQARRAPYAEPYAEPAPYTASGPRPDARPAYEERPPYAEPAPPEARAVYREPAAYQEPAPYVERPVYPQQQPYLAQEPYRQQASSPPPDDPRGPSRHQSPHRSRGGRGGRGGGKRVLIVLVVLIPLLAVGAVLAVLGHRSSPAAASTGDCVQVMSSVGGTKVQRLACSDAKAIFKVADRLPGAAAKCPSGDYAEYTQTGGGSDFKLCLMLNAATGDCFSHLAQATQAARVACASAETEVVKVAKGKASLKACRHTKADHALVYSSPATTICTRKP